MTPAAPLAILALQHDPGSDFEMPHISLDDENGEFVIRQLDDDEIEQQRMVVTSDDVFRLCQSAQALTDLILARQSRPGAAATVLTLVAQVELNTDLHKTAIHLTMIDSQGVQVGYSMPPDVGRWLAERLPVYLSEIDSAEKGRIRQ